MIPATGTSPVVNTTPPSGASTASAEAELARYRKQLADCVSCETADTKQGKADIQEISNKIKIAEARLENATTNRADKQAVLSSAVADKSSSESTHTVHEPGILTTNALISSDSSEPTPGTHINVYV